MDMNIELLASSEDTGSVFLYRPLRCGWIIKQLKQKGRIAAWKP